MRSLVAAALLALAGSSVLFPASAQHAGHAMERLGTVAFEVACNDAAQKEFERGMALYHSFAWPAASGGPSRRSDTSSESSLTGHCAIWNAT